MRGAWNGRGAANRTAPRGTPKHPKCGPNAVGRAPCVLQCSEKFGLWTLSAGIGVGRSDDIVEVSIDRQSGANNATTWRECGPMNEDEFAEAERGAEEAAEWTLFDRLRADTGCWLAFVLE